MKKGLAVLGLFLALTCGSASAQGVVRVLTPNGQPATIPIIIRQGLGDIARGGNGVVLADPALLSMPFEFQQFVLSHEAAHAIGIMNETSADYFGGQMLRIAGFTPDQMQIVFQSMATFLGSWGDATHLPSRLRIQVVANAYAGQ